MNQYQATRPLHPPVAVPYSLQGSTAVAMSDQGDERLTPAERFYGDVVSPPERDRPRPSAFWQGMLWALGILTATVTGSAFVIAGMLAGAAGFSAILLAAAMPLTAFAWAVTLSTLNGHKGRPDGDAAER